VPRHAVFILPVLGKEPTSVKLLDGVVKYTSDVHPSMGPLFDELAAGQTPEALLLASSDARVDPSLLTQTPPGSVFVCRNAGNVVPPRQRHQVNADGTVASIEYAVKALEVSEIIVCGNSDCDTVKAALGYQPIAGMGAMSAWLDNVATGNGATIDDAIEANVVAQLEHLSTHDFVREAEAAGRLTLSGWVYDVPTGAVRVFDGSEFVQAKNLLGA
jgi:carbonic anhydrase